MIKTLSRVPEGSVNAYKVPKRCADSLSVCCELTSSKDNRDGAICTNGVRYGKCQQTCTKGRKFQDTSCNGRVCCEMEKNYACPGYCMKECSAGWSEVVQITTSTTPENLGEFVIEEKFSADEVFCPRSDEKCCTTTKRFGEEIQLCGRRNTNVINRISFGEDAEFAEFPWLVIIGTTVKLNETATAMIYQSSGSLISPTVSAPPHL